METRKSLILKTSVVIFVIFLINMSFFLFKFGTPQGGISGFSITSFKQNFSTTYDKIPTASKIFFLSAWFIFLSLITGVFIRDKFLSEKKSQDMHLHLNYGKFQTDLDVLYDVLKNKQRLKIKTVSTAFKISPNQAMEWAKILETGKLASIEYPGLFGDPELVLR